MVLVAVFGLAATAGCGGDSLEADDARAETAPLAKRDLNLRRGTWRGVGVGATRRQVVRQFGRVRGGEPWAPIGDDDTTGPPTPRDPPDAGRFGNWRGRHFAFATINGRAYMLIVTARGSKTQAGVGMGDTLAEVRAAYPKLRCGVANEGTEWPDVPHCTGRVARHRYVWFGGDPVSSVTLAAVPLR